MAQQLVDVVIANADPANAVLLMLIYQRLRSEHRDVRSVLERVRDRVATLEQEHPEV